MAEVEAMLVGADVPRSLHNTEGFGLPVAEAMALGKSGRHLERLGGLER